MARNLFQRDFTPCKALVLAGLIATALVMGSPQTETIDMVDDQATPTVRIIPAAVLQWMDCDTDKADKGIAL